MSRVGSRYLLGGLAAIVLALAGCGKAPQKEAAKLPTVTVAVPEERAVLEYEDLPGRVAAIENVEVKARVTGFLNKVHFQEGTEVNKGDLLYTIDPREFQADLDSAAAALQEAQAQMAQAKSDYVRSKQLSTQKVIAAQEKSRALLYSLPRRRPDRLRHDWTRRSWIWNTAKFARRSPERSAAQM